jgi:hypothetical protein
VQLILRRCGRGVGGVVRNAARSIYEDFEKTPKTSGDATKVYREESVTRSKSKSSYAYLSKFNRKMLHVEKIEKLLYILI